ncbi:MAG: hypothetical protein LBU28_10335 [Spirochaetaceae bacterium]|nr:hypothetical protein [Spirochaetaceae bacterium]
MTVKNHLPLVYGVVFLIGCMGCALSPVETDGGEPIGIGFIPHFIIENESSTAAAISLKKAYHYNGAWDVLSEAGRESDSPVNAELAPNEDVALETWTSIRADVDFPIIASFALTIAGKHYVGWAAGSGTGDLREIVQYGLGYVRIVPGEIDLRNPAPVLTSTLTPAAVEQNESRKDVTATYRVTITDGEVSFALEKQSVVY